MPTLVHVPADDADDMPQQSSAANVSSTDRNSVITPAKPTPNKQKKRSQQQLTLDALFGGVTKKPKSRRQDTHNAAAKENTHKVSTTKTTTAAVAAATTTTATLDAARKSALLNICVGRICQPRKKEKDTAGQE